MLVTHLMEEAERLCDRVALIDHGKVIALGPPTHLGEQAATSKRGRLRASGPLQTILEALPEVTAVEHHGARPRRHRIGQPRNGGRAGVRPRRARCRRRPDRSLNLGGRVLGVNRGIQNGGRRAGPHVITPVVEPRARRWRPYRVLAVTDFGSPGAYPVGLVFGVGLPMLLLVIFGSIPSLTQPKKEFGGVSFFTIYTPTLVVLVLLVLALLSVPVQMAGYREQGVLRRMTTTPVPAPRSSARSWSVNIILAAVAIAMLLGVGAGAFNLVLPAQAGWFVLSLLLTVAAMFGIGLCMAALPLSPQVANAIGRPSRLPVRLLFGAVGPAHRVPLRRDQPIAKVLPSGAGL